MRRATTHCGIDGLLHYQRPETVKKDLENQAIYEKYGYKVVRIPYFIQLTQAVVKELFGVEVNEPLFSPDIPSMSAQDKNTPAYCCPAGLKRMAEELKRFPQQWQLMSKRCITKMTS